MTKNSTSKAKAKASASKSAVVKPGAQRKAPAQVAKAVKAVSPEPRKAVAAKVAASAKRAAPAAKTAPAKAGAAKSPATKAPAAVQSAAKKAPAKSSPPLKTVPVASAQPAQALVSPETAVAAVDKKPVSQRHGFKTSEYIVYPAHGVGRIVSIEEQEVAGLKLELFVITFEKDKMTLRVPTSKTTAVGMRKLSETNTVGRAMETLKGRARIKRTMWSRRAQEYEAKINSGDLIAIAEVVRDLYRSENQPEQSYSERQLYEAALDRMAREIAAVERLDDRGAVQKITEVLARSARGMRVERAENEENHQAA